MTLRKKLSLGIVILLFALPLIAQDNSPAVLKFYDSGVQKQIAEDFYGAAEDFNEAVQRNPAFSDAWFHLAQVTYEVGDYSLVLNYLEKAEKFAKDKTEILNLRGMTLISLDRLEEARKIFTDVLKSSPNNVDARFGLAELDLFEGRYDGAERMYLDALKRETDSRKALLSLAVLSAETGKNDTARKYLDQALRRHSGESEVHYLAAYLEARAGNFSEAERRARAAVQLNGNFTGAYVLLASVLYSQKRWGEVIDICDYLIAKDRKLTSAWYLKGLSNYRLGDSEKAISIWSTALSIVPQDEIMRAILELVVNRTLPIEDNRRSSWSDYHIARAREYAKVFEGEAARYEYQQALSIDPNNISARYEFAEVLRKIGLNELYLEQLRFIQSQQAELDAAAEEKSGKKLEKSASQKSTERKISDTVESYSSLMKYELPAKWNVQPFYLDKNRWNVGIFYKKSPAQLVHCDGEEIAAAMAADIFRGIATTTVAVSNQEVSGYGEAFSRARKSKLDYFVLLSFDESEREVSLDAVIYNGRNGTETKRFSVFRTGNGRFTSVLRSFRRSVLEMLPIRGKIIARNGNEILIDLGKSEGLVKNAMMDVVKAGAVKTADTGTGVVFRPQDSLGNLDLSSVGEEISQGTLTQKGFYDRVNIGDEVLVKSMPKYDSEGNLIADANPAADENGNKIESKTQEQKKRITAEDLGLVKTPPFIDLIRSIH